MRDFLIKNSIVFVIQKWFVTNWMFFIQYQDKEKGLARIRGASDPAVYWCNLGMCQCEEFKKTHKPCKHIYKIALDKGLIKKEGGLL